MKKVSLLNLPTPLHKIDVNSNNNYFIKRDDLTGLTLGGNKARKVEYFFADLLEKRCNYVVTYGSAQSNHCRIVAAAAAKLGIKCKLILEDSQKAVEPKGNEIFYKLLDADIIWCKVEDVKETISRTLNDIKRQGYRPYFIQGGGHGNLGTHAYVETYMEISEQSKTQGLHFDYIFTASGTGTTQAGLVAGKKITNGQEKIVGISVARSLPRGAQVVRDSVESYLKYINSNINIENRDIIFDDSYIGKGYADIYKAIIDAITFMLKHNSIVLDPVYTGKAFYGMCEYLKRNNIRGKNILFIHTGGLPCFFAHGNKLIRTNK